MRRALAGAAVLTALFLGVVAATAAEAHKGRLRILFEGKPIGAEEYEITGTATEVEARGTVTMNAGVEMEQTTTLLLFADLTPRSYEWKQEKPRPSWLRLAFNGPRATIHFPRPDGQPDEQEFEFPQARVAVIDNNVFHHFLLLARHYDFAKGGAQKISVFVPQSVQPGEVTLELQGVETMKVDGADQPVRKLAITTADNQILLWVTEAGAFVRLLVPSAQVEILPDSP